MVHRVRALVVTHRTALVNRIRGLLGEFGRVVAKGVAQLRRELPDILANAENGLPVVAREVLSGLLERLRDLDERIRDYDRQIRICAADGFRHPVHMELKWDPRPDYMDLSDIIKSI
jgi:transposase